MELKANVKEDDFLIKQNGMLIQITGNATYTMTAKNHKASDDCPAYTSNEKEWFDYEIESVCNEDGDEVDTSFLTKESIDAFKAHMYELAQERVE